MRTPFAVLCLMALLVLSQNEAAGQSSSGAAEGGLHAGNLEAQMMRDQINVRAAQEGGDLLPGSTLVDCDSLKNQNDRRLGVAHVPKSLLEEEFSIQAPSNKIIQGDVYAQGCAR